MQRANYLSDVTGSQATQLAAVNERGLEVLRRYLDSGQAVAFLGAGVSAPLYPSWTTLIEELIIASVERGLTAEVAGTCRLRAAAQPDSVVELIRRALGDAHLREVLREVLRPRRAPDSGRSWTLTHELVCRCAFRGVITTNYDPGIVDARMRVRPEASCTGFTSWSDELGLDRWDNGEAFSDHELPVLFAHGYHSRPDEIVLATTEYRRAYAGRLAPMLGRQVRTGPLVWLGFSFTDSRIAAILREVAANSGTRLEPGAIPRHVAVMAWDPDPVDAAIREHTYNSKEAATGSATVGGGGCGCN